MLIQVISIIAMLVGAMLFLLALFINHVLLAGLAVAFGFCGALLMSNWSEDDY